MWLLLSTPFLLAPAAENSVRGGSLPVGAVWALVPGLERRRVCVPFLDAGGRPLPISHGPWDAMVHHN